MGDEVVLRFGVETGKSIDAVQAAQALIAWVRLVEATAHALDPTSDYRVSLLGVNEGSLEFRQLIDRVERFAAAVSSGADEWPTLKKGGLALAGIALAAVSAQVAADLMHSGPEKVQLVDPVAATKAGADPEVQKASHDFYGALQNSPVIVNVDVAPEPKAAAIVSVPRDEFAERSGLWGKGEIVEETASVREVSVRWDVVLIKPASVGAPRAWRFSRDGVEFSAVMRDGDFLEAIREGRVPIAIQEGVTMRLAVRYREKLVGQAWQYVPQSRSVTKVLSPLPTNGRSPALPFSDRP